MTQIQNGPKLGLGKLDVIHAFPSSGKSGLVSSAFNEGREIPYVIDTDAILFGYVMPNAIHHQLSEAGNAPWKSHDPKVRLWWKLCEASAMQIAFAVAKLVKGVVVTNLSGTQPFWDSKLVTMTFAPTEDDSWQRHVKRSESSAKRLTDETVVRSWHKSYMKHVHEWKHSHILEEGEYLTDYFGIKYIEYTKDFEAKYYKWLYAKIALMFPNWNHSKWAERIPPKGEESGNLIK